MAVIQYIGGGPVPIPSKVVGPRGPKGWTPVIVGVPNGARKVLLLADWTGGVAPKPATGYIGPAGLVADIADAVDFAGRGLTSVAQDQDANLVINYNDNSTDIIPAYFAPMLAAAAEVDADAQAVELSRQAVVGIQADVVTRQSQINDTKIANDATKVAIDAKAVEVESKRVEVNSITAQAANIVFNGSTDFPTIPLGFYWHCDGGEFAPEIDLGYTGNLMVTDRRGLMRSVPNAARPLDFNSLSRACLGMPMWEARTNLFTSSTNVEGWNYTYLTATTDPAEKAPDGSSAVYFTDSGINSTHHFRKNGIQAFSTVYTFSVYVKAKSPVSIFKMMALLDTTTAAVTFNLSTLAVTPSGPGYISSSLTPVGNGWYRATMTYTSGASGTNNYIDVRVCNSSGAENYTPDGTNSIYFWGPQFEAGAFASPYIPTSGSALSRGNMVPIIQGSAFQRDWGATEGTVVLEFIKDTSNTRIVTLANLYDASSRILWVELTTGNIAQFRSATNNGNIVIHYGSIVNGVNRFAYSYKNGRLAGSLNGGAVQASTALTLTAPLSRIELSMSGYILNNHVRELSGARVALPDAQLMALSKL